MEYALGVSEEAVRCSVPPPDVQGVCQCMTRYLSVETLPRLRTFCTVNKEPEDDQLKVIVGAVLLGKNDYKLG